MKARRGSRWSLYLLVLLGAVAWYWSASGAPGLRPRAAGGGASRTERGVDTPTTSAAEHSRAGTSRATAQDRLLAVRLLDPRGRPVVGAHAAVGGTTPGPPVTTRSDEQGRVRLRVPARIVGDRPHVTFVAGAGQVAWRALEAPDDWYGELRLGAPVRARGRLVLPDGSPAGGLPVRLRQVGLLGDARGLAQRLYEALVGPDRAARAATVTTDPLGRFTLEGLDPGLYLVESRPSGPDDFERLYLASHRGSLVDLFEAPDAELELVVDGLACELVLFDRDFSALPGARFELAGATPDGERWSRTLTLDAGAREGLLWLPPTRRMTVVGGRPDLLAVERTVDLGDEPAGVLRVELTSPGLPGVALLRPRLLGPDGAALPFLLEARRVEDDDAALSELPSLPGEPDWFGPLEPGVWRLGVTGQGDRHPLAGGLALPYEPLPVRVELRAGEARTLELPAVRARRLRLTLGGGGAPVERVEVLTDAGAQALTFVDPGDGRRRVAPRPDRVQLGLEPIPRGEARLRVLRADGSAREVLLPAGELDLELRVDP